jgi:hypothetical protein
MANGIATSMSVSMCLLGKDFKRPCEATKNSGHQEIRLTLLIIVYLRKNGKY